MLCSFSQSNFGQEAGESIIGFKVGYNFIDYQEDANELSSTSGYHAGMYVSFRFNYRFGFQPEILYSQHRASGILITESKATYGYVVLPLTAKIFVTRQLNIQVVPQIGQLIGATMRFPGVQSVNGKIFFKATDISLGTGIGIEAEKGFNASVRYFYGLSDSFKPVVGFERGRSSKNTLQVSIAYTLL